MDNKLLEDEVRKRIAESKYCAPYIEYFIKDAKEYRDDGLEWVLTASEEALLSSIGYVGSDALDDLRWEQKHNKGDK